MVKRPPAVDLSPIHSGKLNSTELNSTGSFSSVRLSSVPKIDNVKPNGQRGNWTQPNWTERSSWVQFSRVQFSFPLWIGLKSTAISYTLEGAWPRITSYFDDVISSAMYHKSVSRSNEFVTEDNITRSHRRQMKCEDEISYWLYTETFNVSHLSKYRFNGHPTT